MQVKSKMKISIIMGIFNCSPTLAEAIDSILAQTYHNWELILCDDGSTDNTYSIAQQYASKYDNIILLRNNRNMGLNYTLNRCLECATGDYIARMDGDDLSLPDRLQIEADFLDDHPEYAIVSTPMIYFDENGIFHTGKGNGEPNKKDIVRHTPFCHAPCMVRREAYFSVGGYTVDTKYLRVEDWQLWIKMYAAGYRGYNLEAPLYMMRDDRNATARRKFKYRINEARLTIFAVNEMKLCKIHYIWCLRPILVGMLPIPIYRYLHRKKLR